MTKRSASAPAAGADIDDDDAPVTPPVPDGDDRARRAIACLGGGSLFAACQVPAERREDLSEATATLRLIFSFLFIPHDCEFGSVAIFLYQSRPAARLRSGISMSETLSERANKYSRPKNSIIPTRRREFLGNSSLCAYSSGHFVQLMEFQLYFGSRWRQRCSRLLHHEALCR